jgi:large subunit ribosomal protein L3
MGKEHKPREGSLAYYPRKKAKTEKINFKTFPKISEEGKILDFFGYKAGMTHVIAIHGNPKSHLSGQEVQIPVTIIECPPMKIFGIRLYRKKAEGIFSFKDYLEKDIPKELGRDRKSFFRR